MATNEALVAVMAFGCLMSGCSTERIPRPETPPPALPRPADAIPGDLDVALRIDLVEARKAFGTSFEDALDLAAVDAHVDPPGGALLRDAVSRSKTAWIAFRPGLPANLTDNVVILRGDFGDLDPRRYEGKNRWGPSVDLGADYRLFERRPPEQRSAPARLYMQSDDLMLFVSEAEIDSVERSVEQRAGDDHVDPPDRGTISAAARLPPIVELIDPRFTTVARVLAPATRLHGHASVDATGLRGALEIAFVESGEALEAETATSGLIESVAGHPSVVGIVAAGAEARTVGENLVVEFSLSPARLGQAVLCAEAPARCAE